MKEIPIVDTTDEQLARWLSGESVHVRSSRRGEAWQCTPDFSCCRPELMAALQIRQAYLNADQSARAKMAMRFLSRLIASTTDERCLITDGETHIDCNRHKIPEQLIWDKETRRAKEKARRGHR
jgi:hypothetical protein